MKNIFIAITTSLILLTGYAHAEPKADAVVKVKYCEKNPDVCKAAAAWCALHEGKKDACKQSPEEYCPNHEAKCKSAI